MLQSEADSGHAEGVGGGDIGLNDSEYLALTELDADWRKIRHRQRDMK